MSGSSCIPKSAGTGQPSQFGHFGEDAHFFGPRGMGVFDGVGGWARHGVDPRVYAQMLMEGCKAELDTNGQNAGKALKASWERNDRLGASTACVAVLDGNNLDITWVGDSQILVVRDGYPLMITPEQTHSFNFPFQLGFGSTDTPDDAKLHRIPVQPGDIIVAASDGLWDNIHVPEVISIVNSETNSLTKGFEFEDRGGDFREPAYESAVQLAHRAFDLSLDPTWESPFCVESRRTQGTDFMGGKPDDITVVVAHVVTSRGLQGAPSWCHTHYSNICERRGGGLGWEDN